MVEGVLAADAAVPSGDLCSVRRSPVPPGQSGAGGRGGVVAAWRRRMHER